MGTEKDKDSKTERERERERERDGEIWKHKEIKPEIAFAAHHLKRYLHGGGPRTYLRVCDCVKQVTAGSTGVCLGPVLGLSVGSGCWAGRFWVYPLYMYLHAFKQVFRASMGDYLTTGTPVRQHSPSGHHFLRPLGAVDEDIAPGVLGPTWISLGIVPDSEGVSDLGIANLIEGYHLWSQTELSP